MAKYWFLLILAGCTTLSKPYKIVDQINYVQKEKRRNDQTEWKLVWEEEFNQSRLDSSKWSTIDLFTDDHFLKNMPELKTEKGAWYKIRNSWASYMTENNPEAIQWDEENILLRAVFNPDTTGFDNRPYHTGGIWTEKKFGFQYGRLEVRAKLEPAYGAWPAIWMIPLHPKYTEQHNGEIDIMERLNHDTFVYQTLHSHWNLNLKLEEPQRYTTAEINPSDYNIYSVSWYPDKIVFGINGKTTLVYPKLLGGGTFQWPYDQPFYLLIDQQLEGWPGDVTHPEELPINMIIDWVRLYQ